MNRWPMLLAPLLLFPWISLHAHHSTAAFFFLDQRISIEGTVVEFHARNPHGLIVLDGIWELNRGWTDHPDDDPDTFERPDFRPSKG